MQLSDGALLKGIALRLLRCGLKMAAGKAAEAATGTDLPPSWVSLVKSIAKLDEDSLGASLDRADIVGSA